MDRREALKKLSAGSAIAVGGSVVMSSTNVAYAASGGTAPTGTIQTNNISFSTWTVEVVLGVSDWVAESRTWNLVSSAVTPKKSQVTSSPAGDRFQVFKADKKGVPSNWKSNDSITVSVTVFFDCGQQTYGPTTLFYV